MDQCIYCLSTSGEFNSEEHIIPESLGNDYLILPKGFVCDRCNHGTLSILDRKLQNFSPIAFLKTLFVRETKQGKYPQAKFQNLVMQKTGYGKLKIFPQDNSGFIKDKEEIGNGWFSFKQEIHGKIFKPKLIARALYKIGLGMIAYAEDKNMALCRRYDKAREFVLKEGGDFPNNLMMRLEGIPNSKSQIKFHHPTSGGTIFYFDIYGLWLIINLETTTVLEINTNILELNFATYPLY